jgi:hypothetical protein
MNVEIPQVCISAPRSQKKKGPAGIAVPPSRDHAPSQKETMNDMTDSTTAPEMTNRAPIYAIESPAIEIARFASILSNLVEGLFDRDRREGSRLDGDVTLRTRHNELDDIEFIVGNVYTLARQIDRATTIAINDHIKREGTGAVAGGRAINQLIARLKGNETPMQLVQAATDLARGVAA